MLVLIGVMVIAATGTAYASSLGQYYNYAASTYDGCRASLATPPSNPTANTATIKSVVQGKTDGNGNSMQVGWVRTNPPGSILVIYASLYDSGSGWQEAYIVSPTLSYGDYPGHIYGIYWNSSDNTYHYTFDSSDSSYSTASSTDWQTQQWCAGIRVSNSSDRCRSDVGFASNGSFSLRIHSSGQYSPNRVNYYYQGTGIAAPFNINPYYAFSFKTTTW